jgi:tetratricopeptide (TPR) repeat protein
MRRRRDVILLLSGILCFQVSLFANDPSNLLTKGREAFQRGKLDDAERYSREALDEAERTGNSVQKGEALGDLGGVLLARGRHAEAKTVCLQALEVLRSSPSKHYLPVVLNNLGALSSENEEFVQAESYLTESLRIIKELNPRDPYRARVLNNLGALHYAMNDMKRAEKDFRQAIDLLEKEHGPNSSELVPLLNNLGGVYVAEKKWDAANALFGKAVTLLKDSSGPELASVFDSVGTMHSARRRYIEAQESFRRSYQIRLDTFGKGHPAVASSAENLASALIATGRYADAENLLNDALQVFEKTFGSQSLQVLHALDKLADVYRKTNREAEAALMEERAEDIRFEREHIVRVESLR